MVQHNARACWMKDGYSGSIASMHHEVCVSDDPAPAAVAACWVLCGGATCLVRLWGLWGVLGGGVARHQNPNCPTRNGAVYSARRSPSAAYHRLGLQEVLCVKLGLGSQRGVCRVDCR